MAFFSDIADAFPYGFAVTYAVKVEGLGYYFMEKVVGTPPSLHTLEPGLIVGASAKVGSVVNRKQGIGRAFDFTFQLEDTPATRALMTRPAFTTALTADVGYTDGTVNVVSTTGFASSGAIWIGNERIDYTGTTATSFTTCTRGYGQAYDHAADSELGTAVTSNPRYWIGRKVTLYAVPIDGYGATHNPDIVTGSAPLWVGHISRAPLRVEGLWQLDARALDRKLDRKAIAAVTGTATWSPDVDPLVVVNPDYEFQAWFTWEADADPTIRTFPTLRPFEGLGGLRHISDLRNAFLAAWESEVTFWNANIDQPFPGISAHAQWSSDSLNGWIPYPGAKRLAFGVDPQYPQTNIIEKLRITIQTSGQQTGFPSGEVNESGWHFIGGSAASLVQTMYWSGVQGVGGALVVTIDDGDASQVPATGALIIESDGQDVVVPYLSATAQADGTVAVEFDESATPAMLFQVNDESVAQSLSVRFGYGDTGPVLDTMRRMLMSSGRGDNDATYDTLAAGQGLDIADVDTGSFPDAFDGPLTASLGVSLLLDSDASFVSTYGGLLALSQRALVARTDGIDVDLEMVRVDLASTGGSAKATITDAHLVSAGRGRKPVRPKHSIMMPNLVQAEVKKTTESLDGTIIVRDVDAMQAQGVERWKIDLLGFDPATMYFPVGIWSHSLFAASQVAQVVEMDVVPYVAVDTSSDLQPGDLVNLDLDHHSLWQWSTGRPGYTGPGRVVGRQLNLSTGIVTLTMLIDGVVSRVALSPSANVLAWAGSAAAPTSIDVAEEYEPVMSQYLADLNPFDLLSYRPSEDTAADVGYRISAVEVTGGVCRLTVASQLGSPPGLTVGYYLTLPDTAGASDAQDDYLHRDTAALFI